MSREVKKSKWGWGVSALYIGFVFFILILIMYASIQDFQMVEENYYEKDLAYQKQIDRMERANRLEKNVSALYNSSTGNIIVQFPVEKYKDISGIIKMFRPSNAELDFEIPIRVDSLGVQEIKTDKMVRGYWLVKILWKLDSVEYFSQSPLMIN